ncbi:MAG: substrate-binding domain-containing protein [Christensenellaceae bacterium]|nr:substrate-binding domain-containing protein [Christensenellaceae bacterium]
MKNKKTAILISVLLVCAMSLAAFTACDKNAEKSINVIGRDSASGTREAFESLIKNSDGTKLEGKMTQKAEELEATSAVIAKVQSNKTAIGYISLGSLDDSVKAVKVNGVAPTVENVQNGSYVLYRPFVIITNKTLTEGDNLTAATKDFLNYLKSDKASKIVADNGFVPNTDNNQTFSSDKSAGTVIIRGSTSVEKVMTILMDGYKKLNPNVTFDINCQGSGAGRTAAKDDTAGNVIGMSSSAIKAEDAGYFAQFDLAQDAVVIIVNKANAIDNLTIQNLYDIYTGAVTRFSEIA